MKLNQNNWIIIYPREKKSLFMDLFWCPTTSGYFSVKSMHTAKNSKSGTDEQYWLSPGNMKYSTHPNGYFAHIWKQNPDCHHWLLRIVFLWYVHTHPVCTIPYLAKSLNVKKITLKIVLLGWRNHIFGL